MADRIVVMNHGVVEQVGTPVEVYTRPRSPFVARFVGPDELPRRRSRASARAGRGSARWSMRHGTAGPLAAGTRLHARHPARGDPGRARPRDGTENRLVTRIRAVQFLGPFTRLSLALPDGAPALECDVAATAFAALGAAEGSELALALRPDALRVFPVASRERRPWPARRSPTARVRHRLGGEDVVRYTLVAALRGRPVPLRALPAAAGDLAQPARQRRRLRGPGQLPALLRDARDRRRRSRTASSSRSSRWRSRWRWPSSTPTALTRTLMPGRGLFRVVAMLPLFAPSLVQALAFIYVFGNNGIFTRTTGLNVGIYGAKGIVLAEVFYCFPHAVLILVAALSATDARLYDAARTLGRRAAQDLPDRDPARRQVRAGERVLRGVHARHHRLRRAQGHRRQVLGDGDRDLQPGLGPAELHDGRDGLGGAADPGGARLPGRPRGAAPPATRSSPRPRSRSRPRRRPARGLGLLRVLRADRGRHRGHVPGDPRLLAGDALAVQLHPDPAPLPLRHGGRVRAALEQRLRGRAAPRWSAPCSPSWAPTWSRSAGRPASGLLYLLSVLPVSIPGMVLGLAYIFTFNAAGSVLNALYGTLAILIVSNVDPLLHGGLPHRHHRAPADGRASSRTSPPRSACRSTGPSGGSRCRWRCRRSWPSACTSS